MTSRIRVNGANFLRYYPHALPATRHRIGAGFGTRFTPTAGRGPKRRWLASPPPHHVSPGDTLTSPYPGRRKLRNPESITTHREYWIPGLRPIDASRKNANRPLATSGLKRPQLLRSNTMMLRTVLPALHGGKSPPPVLDSSACFIFAEIQSSRLQLAAHVELDGSRRIFGREWLSPSRNLDLSFAAREINANAASILSAEPGSCRPMWSVPPGPSSAKPAPRILLAGRALRTSDARPPW